MSVIFHGRQWRADNGGPAQTPHAGGRRRPKPERPIGREDSEEEEEEEPTSVAEEEEDEEEEEDKLWRRRVNFGALETPPPLLPTHKSIRSR